MSNQTQQCQEDNLYIAYWQHESIASLAAIKPGTRALGSLHLIVTTAER